MFVILVYVSCFICYPLVLILVPVNLAYHVAVPAHLILALMATPVIFSQTVLPPKYLLVAVLLYILNGLLVTALIYSFKGELDLRACIMV